MGAPASPTSAPLLSRAVPPPLGSSPTTRRRSARIAAADGGGSAAPSAPPPPPRPPRRRRSLLAKLGQSWNPTGIALFGRVLLGGSAPLALPHLSIPDVASLDWAALKAAGFTGAVFDKDNTLTAPYSSALTAAGAAAVAGATAVWGRRGVALLSNSAGLAQYDPDGEEAAALEAALGVAVIRHATKKPGGGPAALAAHFGLATPGAAGPGAAVASLVMVGDRYLTDVVYGNRLGLLTVRPAPVTAAGEPRAVRLARRVEDALVRRWTAQGRTAPPHPLAPTEAELRRFVKK